MAVTECSDSEHLETGIRELPCLSTGPRCATDKRGGSRLRRVNHLFTQSCSVRFSVQHMHFEYCIVDSGYGEGTLPLHVQFGWKMLLAGQTLFFTHVVKLLIDFDIPSSANRWDAHVSGRFKMPECARHDKGTRGCEQHQNHQCKLIRAWIAEFIKAVHFLWWVCDNTFRLHSQSIH